MMPSKETEERKQHSTAFVPYSCYECRLPEEFINVPMHWHNEFEINYIVEGRGEFICDNNRFTAEEGDVLLLPPNILHAAYLPENSKLVYYALVFNPILLGANNSDRCTTDCIRPVINGNIKIKSCIPSDAKNYPEIKASVSRIFSYAHSNSSQMDLLLKSELLRFFWLLETDEEIICQKDTGISYSEVVRPALDFMARNFQENISVEQLADIVHLSKSYFMSCFKNAVGVGAIEHLTQLRISAACEALSATQKRIGDIAFSCGYNNLSNFNRQFKEKMGCSPNEYRKRCI